MNEVKINKSEIKGIDKEINKKMAKIYKSICKITYHKECGSGFLIKLPKDGEEICCLMTNHHVIRNTMIKSKEIVKVEYKFQEKSFEIKLDPKERFIQYDPNLDFTIIDVHDIIKDKYFLSPNTKNIHYINEDIYILHYPGGDILSASEGKIIKINDNNELVYDASTESGSSGSPIFLKDKTEVIGIHKAGSTYRKENYGTLINSIIQFIQSKNENISIIKDNQKNEILCIYNKKEDEINLLHDYSINYFLGEEQYIEGKNNINGKNIEIYINNKKIKFNYKYESNEKGEIKVKFIFNKLLTSTAYMFSDCSSLKSIDLSSFNTNNVNNMNSMFSGCSSLQSINLYSFNTTNVNNMGLMFFKCSSLQSIDLSSFKTTNVKDMWGMFMECSSLQSIDLSSFNTTNVNYMCNMFWDCKSLKSIDLSSFNTTNVKAMYGMFGYSSLKKRNVKIGGHGKEMLDQIEE